MDESDRRLGDYVEALEAARGNSGGASVDRESYERVARELGMSDADLARAAEDAERALELGAGHADEGLFEEAEREFARAAALMPWDPRPHVALSRLFLARANGLAGVARSATERATLLRGASDRAARAHGIDPRDKAAVAALRIARKAEAEHRNAGRSRTRAAFGAISALGAIAALIVLAPVFGHGGASGEAGAGSGSLSPESGSASIASTETGARVIPVEWASGDQPISLTGATATLERFGSGESASWSLRVQCALLPEGRGLERLALELEYRDPSGAMIFKRSVDALADHESSVWPGETIPFSSLVYEKGDAPDVASVLVRPGFVKVAPGNAPPAISVEASPDFVPPDGFGVEFGYRGETRSSYEGGNSYHDFALVFANRGSLAITLLKVRVEWFDREGRKIDQNSWYLLIEDGPPFLPGETRIDRCVRSLPKGSGKAYAWTLHVEEARFGR